MENQRRTFISYSRSNKEFVVKLAKELRAEGFPVWLDILDIPPGSRWDREVEKALKESEIFMIILTRASTESENVLDEIGYAIDHRKRIMPVLMENCEIPLRLTRFQYIDFTNKNFDEGIAAAKDLLRSLIEQPTVPRKDVIDVPQQPDQARVEQTTRSKAEAEGQSKEDVNRIAANKNEDDRAARQKADKELAEKAKAESERKAKENARPAEGPSTKRVVPSQNKPASKEMVYGIGVVVVLVILGIAFNTYPNIGKQNTPTPIATLTRKPAVTQSPVKKQENPTKLIPTSTATYVLTSTPPEVIPTMGAGSTMLGNDGMTLLYVPAGKFIMGSNMDGNDEKPSHPVEISAFWIDQTEITNEMYKNCVEARSCEKPDPTTYYVDSSYAKNPVVFVTWQDAVDYCAYVGRRLPTEAEWEKAARGDDERKYPWGNQAASKDLLNYLQTNIGHTTPVNSYPGGASPYGAVDMAGNVIEWVNDLYSTNYYQKSPAMDPKGASSGSLHVVRGGSFKSDLEDVTTYRRASENPKNSLGTMGFRCARDE